MGVFVFENLEKSSCSTQLWKIEFNAIDSTSIRWHSFFAPTSFIFFTSYTCFLSDIELQLSENSSYQKPINQNE